VIVGIDPGKATGVAVWINGYIDNELTGEYTPAELYQFLEEWADEIEHAQVEWFTISARTIKTEIDYNALHLIGAIQLMAWKHQFHVSYTNPGDVKDQFPNKALKQAGMWHTSDHARDALRHLCYHLVRVGDISPRLFLID
jgi:hypothetical protein